MSSVNEIYKLIKGLTSDEREQLEEKLKDKLPREPAIKYCQFCSCRLWMGIEKQHLTCWDCHYEGKLNKLNHEKESASRNEP